MQTTTLHKINNRLTDDYIELVFFTDFVSDDFDFSDFTILLAKTNNTEITCDYCTDNFTITNPFYSIDNSAAFCASHLPSEILTDIKL